MFTKSKKEKPMQAPAFTTSLKEEIEDEDELEDELEDEEEEEELEMMPKPKVKKVKKVEKKPSRAIVIKAEVISEDTCVYTIQANFPLALGNCEVTQ